MKKKPHKQAINIFREPADTFFLLCSTSYSPEVLKMDFEKKCTYILQVIKTDQESTIHMEL